MPYKYCMSCAAEKAINTYEQCEKCYNHRENARNYNPYNAQSLDTAKYTFEGKLYKDINTPTTKTIAVTNCVFVFDVTGSMGPYIDAAKKNIIDIIESFEKNQKQILNTFEGFTCHHHERNLLYLPFPFS